MNKDQFIKSLTVQKYTDGNYYHWPYQIYTQTKETEVLIKIEDRDIRTFYEGLASIIIWPDNNKIYGSINGEKDGKTFISLYLYERKDNKWDIFILPYDENGVFEPIEYNSPMIADLEIELTSYLRECTQSLLN